MKQKKSIVCVFVFLLLAVSSAAYAGWLDDVSKTVGNVHNTVNPKKAVKTTISKIVTSGYKYVNRYVEISGTVTGMAVLSKNKYVIQLTDNKKAIKCDIKHRPTFRLEDKITVQGMYDGHGIVNTIIPNQSSSLF
jgi:hypothetical protein